MKNWVCYLEVPGGVWRNEAVAQSSPIRRVSDSFTAVQVTDTLLFCPDHSLYPLRTWGKNIQGVNKFPMPLSPKFICIFGMDGGGKTCDTQRGLKYYQGFQTPTGFSLSGKQLATIMAYFLLECMLFIHSQSRYKCSWESRMPRLTKERMTGLLLKVLFSTMVCSWRRILLKFGWLQCSCNIFPLKGLSQTSQNKALCNI